jgi:hypothetical protein
MNAMRLERAIQMMEHVAIQMLRMEARAAMAEPAEVDLAALCACKRAQTGEIVLALIYAHVRPDIPDQTACSPIAANLPAQVMEYVLGPMSAPVIQNGIPSRIAACPMMALHAMTAIHAQQMISTREEYARARRFLILHRKVAPMESVVAENAFQDLAQCSR